MNRSRPAALGLFLAACWTVLAAASFPAAAWQRPDPLADDNLVAWCIVPFDAKKRTPAQRAQMLQELGLRRCAYDWRAEHVPTFEQEILEYKQRGIEFFAFWDVHEEAFALFEKYDLHPQIWRILGDPPGASDAEKIEAAVQQWKPLAERTRRMKCRLGLYNHGGWGGEPEHLVAVCKLLREQGYDHVGIVYNFHHGHGHIEDWPAAFAAMKPYLICLNLNGMNPRAEPKILGIGQGRHEEEMIRVVVESGYDGPIGVLDHREQLDARESLEENLRGLRELRRKFAAERPEHAEHAPSDAAAGAQLAEAIPHDPQRAVELARQARRLGDAERGAMVFADARSACLSCHRIGPLGGDVGPALDRIAAQRTDQQLVESLLWPNHEVKPEFTSWRIITASGRVHTGYRQDADGGRVLLRDPAKNTTVLLDRDEIEEEVAVGSLMPANLAASLTHRQQWDLLRFVMERDGSPLRDELQTAMRHAGSHAPAAFDYVREPLRPGDWPHWKHPVNQHRLYDFYAKQAEHFRQLTITPRLLSAFPGLDGGEAGHWGYQTEKSWEDDRWNDTDLGSLQAGVFHAPGRQVPRGVCVRLGEQGELAACFNPDTLTYDAVWRGGFLKFSPVRHGFLNGLQADGELVDHPREAGPAEPFAYQGFYRVGPRVVFAYRIGDVEYLDSPWCENGRFVRQRAPRDQHPLAGRLDNPPPQWPQTLRTAITFGQERPYAVDTIHLPHDNPWRALMFCGGHDFLPNGDALVCTMQGDVWRVSGLDGRDGEPAEWRRFASGLHHALGLLVSEGQVYVQCRDQLTRLHDLNDDGEADFYECFSNAFQTSPAGHDYICGLQRDGRGNFYTASGNQGLVRISPDGTRADVVATGFRNPDGLGITPDDWLTVPCSEGEWTPASMICAVPAPESPLSPDAVPPHFGYRGPRDGQPPQPPLAYVPRGLDNSSGEQTYVASDRWGPFAGLMVHLSFGAGSHFLLLRDEVRGVPQGAVVPLPGDFLSGAHRGRFRPQDGQLYVSGMDGWVSFTPDDGCFQRVRYTGDRVLAPLSFHVHENGVLLRFSEPLDREVAEDVRNHFAQTWNYRYGAGYGSPEYSPSHRGVQGHDPLVIVSAHLLRDQRSLFLHMPDLQPVSQLQLRLNLRADAGDMRQLGQDMFLTVHALDEPFTEFPGYQPFSKIVAAHPLLVDLASEEEAAPNPYLQEIPGARAIEIATGKNLTYEVTEFKARASEPLALTLRNPDVVPHNWALVRRDALTRVGQMANQLIADPTAAARQYIPDTADVLAYTDVVAPGQSFTIYFQAPEQPGRYPYLCTFPGHWMVMNGVMVVE